MEEKFLVKFFTFRIMLMCVLYLWWMAVFRGSRGAHFPLGGPEGRRRIVGGGNGTALGTQLTEGRTDGRRRRGAAGRAGRGGRPASPPPDLFQGLRSQTSFKHCPWSHYLTPERPDWYSRWPRSNQPKINQFCPQGAKLLVSWQITNTCQL